MTIFGHCHNVLINNTSFLLLGTVSCFSELDFHCLYVKNPPKRIALWACASSEYENFPSFFLQLAIWPTIGNMVVKTM